MLSAYQHAVVDKQEYPQAERERPVSDRPYSPPPLPIKQGRYLEDYQPDLRHIFIGFDARQPAAYQVCSLSILVFSQASTIAVSPIKWECLPISRHGLTPFTFARFLVPWVMNYQGFGLFCDPDSVFLHDPEELFEMVAGDPSNPVWVVPKDGETAFEESAFMVFNCGHPDCKTLTPERINDQYWNPLKLDWATKVGALPPEWHNIVLYEEPNEKAKWIHYTAGVPGFPECKDVPLADRWHKMAALGRMLRPWKEVMGPSVHVKKVVDYIDQKAREPKTRF